MGGSIIMKNRKSSFITIISLILIAGLFSGIAAGCSSAPEQAAKEPVEVKVGTTSDEPRIWEAIEKKLAEENIKITIVNFANGANPNEALADGEVDLNAFQHYAYFDKNKADLKLDLTAIGDTLIVPLNLFSQKVKSVDELKEGAKIAIPNDVTNQGRALHVLQSAGIIKLKDGAGLNPTLKDIAENPKNIQFVELPGGQLPRSLPDVDAAIINCGYAVDAGLDPNKDPIYRDKVDLNDPNKKPYINIIAARTADKDNEVYKKIVDAYHSDEIAELIIEVYKGAAIPAWDEKYVK
jgi:D-methionine transport system substrate-binding protein